MSSKTISRYFSFERSPHVFLLLVFWPCYWQELWDSESPYDVKIKFQNEFVWCGVTWLKNMVLIYFDGILQKSCVKAVDVQSRQVAKLSYDKDISQCKERNVYIDFYLFSISIVESLLNRLHSNFSACVKISSSANRSLYS